MCTVTVNTAPADHPSPFDLAAFSAALKRNQRHRKHCRKCGYGRSGPDNGILGRKRCYSCDVRTVEAIVRRLVDRVGTVEALRQLRALAPKK